MKYIKCVIIVYLAFITLLIFSLTGKIYGVNDDVIIQNWLSGVFTGKPEFMIRGSATPKISFGFLLSNLYSFAPNINWFPISILGITLISWFILGLVSFRAKNYLVVASYLILSFLYLIWFIPSPTYTAAAIILSFSVFIYFAINVLDSKISKFNVILAFLLSLSYLIRPESFILGFVTALSFIIYAITKTSIKNRILMRNLLTPILIFFSVVLIDASFEKIYYSQHQDWVKYSKWEDARYKIQANAPEKAVSDDPQKYGWTRSEVELFKTYNFIDRKIFTTEKFNDLLKDTNSSRTVINFNFIENAHQRIFDGNINWNWINLISMISLFFAIFFFSSFPKIKDYFLLSGASLIILYLVMLYVSGFLRQPERVQLSAIFLANLVSILGFSFTIRPSLKFSWGKNLFLNATVFILIISLVYSQTNIFKNKVGKNIGAFWIDQTKYLENYPKDSIFVGNASQFRNNYVSPYSLKYFDIENRIFTFGWHNFSPHWDLRARQLGLDPDNILENVINDDRVYWVSGRDSMNFIVEFMKEKNLTFVGPNEVGKMENFGEEYIVWKFNEND
jgi:hypothetical protein